MRKTRFMTENQRYIQDLRYEFLVLFQSAKEQGVDMKNLLKVKVARLNKKEKLRFFIRILNNKLLEI